MRREHAEIARQMGPRRRRKTALDASRINYIRSIPMLLCMAGATHGLPL